MFNRASERNVTLMMTDQKPIGSGFGAASTAAEVIDGIDLTGKVTIVTGGYSGLTTAGESNRYST